MHKEEFIHKVKETHNEYESMLARLSCAQLTQPMTCGEWSVKDVITHVTWYERQIMGMLSTRTLAGSPWWNLSLEERNAAIETENKERLLEEILDEAHIVYAELITQLENLSEEDLHSARNFKDMPAEWKPWEVIASNTFQHYPDHTRDIQAAFQGKFK